MSISELLIDKNKTERADIKATALYDLISPLVASEKLAHKDYSFTLVDGRKVTIEEIGLGILDLTIDTVTKRTDGGANPIWFKINVDGVYLNKDGWYGYANPPILVPDENGIKEDLLLAIKTIIADSLGEKV